MRKRSEEGEKGKERVEKVRKDKGMRALKKRR